MSTARQRSRLLTGLAAAAVVIGFLNFLWFISESSTVGDANRGYVQDGRYYLVHAGRATEVPRETYEWSAIHGASLFVTHPLAMAGGAYLLFTITFPSMVGSSRLPEDRLRVDRIRGSGPILAGGRAGGRIGDLSMTRPLINVEVRRGGVILLPFGLQPIGIESGAIIAIEPDHSFLRGSGFLVLHRQAGAPRVRLLFNADDPVVAALRLVAAGKPATGDPGDALPMERPREPYSREMKAMILGGFALSLVFAVVAIPFGTQLGSFGFVWSIAVVAIIGFNLWTYFIRNRDRW